MNRGKLTALILSLIILTGCAADTTGLSPSILKPTLNHAPMEGRWIVTRVVHAKDPHDQVQQYIGATFILNKDVVLFNDQLLEHPQYTMMKGRAEYFVDLRYNIPVQETSITSENLFAITVGGEGELYFRLYQEKEDVAYIDLYGNLFELMKTKTTLEARKLDLLLQNAHTEKIYYSL
ncbi:MAG: hypothetical protein Q4E76_01940 [Tissierellia bacterium]|nr:hypothetical protein [Tissierellia bacterium]